MWWGTGFALDAGQDSSRHLEDSMDCVGSGGRTIRDGGTDGKQNKKNDSEHNQWHMGNIFQVWSCENLVNLGS
jgi:spore coat protein CotH